MSLYREKESGYTKALYFSLNGIEAIQQFKDFLTLHEEELTFTEEQSQWIWSSIITSMKIGASYRKEPIKWLDAAQTEAMIKLYGAKANIKELIDLSFDATILGKDNYELTY